jgi:hypothetical protein
MINLQLKLNDICLDSLIPLPDFGFVSFPVNATFEN